jgi:deoxyribodipyrimidine photolyase
MSSQDLATETAAKHLFWNRRYSLPERTVDAAVKEWAGQQRRPGFELPGESPL